MNISRLIDPALIELSMKTRIALDPENPERSKRQIREDQVMILDELVGVLERSAKIANRSKLLTEFINRERKAATAVGHGIAIPHVRTYQAKELILAVARSEEGYDFGALDGAPVRLFFVMAAPSYDDNLYLKVFKALAELLQFNCFREQLMTIQEPFQIVRAFREME